MNPCRADDQDVKDQAPWVAEVCEIPLVARARQQCLRRAVGSRGWGEIGRAGWSVPAAPSL